MSKLIEHQNMDEYDVWQAAAHLRQPVSDLLHDFGPLRPEALKYLLKQRYDVTVSAESLRGIVWVMEHELKLLSFTSEGACYLPGQKDKDSTLPQPHDYTEAFYRLYHRWQAVRENPELLGLTDEMIDALYLPTHVGVHSA